MSYYSLQGALDPSCFPHRKGLQSMPGMMGWDNVSTTPIRFHLNFHHPSRATLAIGQRFLSHGCFQGTALLPGASSEASPIPSWKQCPLDRFDVSSPPLQKQEVVSFSFHAAESLPNHRTLQTHIPAKGSLFLHVLDAHTNKTVP